MTELSKLPGIGKKSAQRLAFYILRQDRAEAASLSGAIIDAKDKIRECEICFNLTEESPCAICSSPKRDRSTICVIEEPADVYALERSGEYHGLYHVLGGVISPLDGIGPDELHMKELLGRTGGIKELIIAVNPSIEGETTTLYISNEIKNKDIKVTKLARGIPMGSAIEHTDQVTLIRAIEGRVDVKDSSDR